MPDGPKRKNAEPFQKSVTSKNSAGAAQILHCSVADEAFDAANWGSAARREASSGFIHNPQDCRGVRRLMDDRIFCAGWDDLRRMPSWLEAKKCCGGRS